MCNGTQEYPGENFINISRKTLTNPVRSAKIKKVSED